MAKKAADAAIGATERALIEMGRKHGRAVHLVNPAPTTMGCTRRGARAEHRPTSFRENVYVHRVRGCLLVRQELRPRAPA